MFMPIKDKFVLYCIFISIWIMPKKCVILTLRFAHFYKILKKKNCIIVVYAVK